MSEQETEPRSDDENEQEKKEEDEERGRLVIRGDGRDVDTGEDGKEQPKINRMGRGSESSRRSKSTWKREKGRAK